MMMMISARVVLCSLLGARVATATALAHRSTLAFEALPHTERVLD